MNGGRLLYVLASSEQKARTPVSKPVKEENRTSRLKVSINKSLLLLFLLLFFNHENAMFFVCVGLILTVNKFSVMSRRSQLFLGLTSTIGS